MTSLRPFIPTLARENTVWRNLTTSMMNSINTSFRLPPARPNHNHHIYCTLHRHLRNLIHTRTQILLLPSPTYHPPRLTISVHFLIVVSSTSISSRPLMTLSSPNTMYHYPPVPSRLTATHDHAIPPTPHRLATAPTIHPSQKQFSIVLPTTRTMIKIMQLTSTILKRVPHATRHTSSTMTLTTHPIPTTTMHLIGTQPTTHTMTMTMTTITMPPLVDC